jgi:thiol:disulfide interchange protein
MRGDTRIEGPVIFQRGEEFTAHKAATANSWRVIAFGVVTTLISFAALGALAWLLTTSGIVPNLISTSGGRRLAVIAVLGLVISFAFGTWFAVRMSRARSSVLVGPAVAMIVLVTSIAVAFPFVGRIADFHSVAVALEIIDAPDVGTQVSDTLDQFVMAESEVGDTAERDVVNSA